MVKLCNVSCHVCTFTSLFAFISVLFIDGFATWLCVISEFGQYRLVIMAQVKETSLNSSQSTIDLIVLILQLPE